MPVLRKGQRFGSEEQQYDVIRKLGEGQFAEVWEVQEANPSSEDIVRVSIQANARRLGADAFPEAPPQPCRAPRSPMHVSLQYAVKVEKRKEWSSVKQEHKVEFGALGRLPCPACTTAMPLDCGCFAVHQQGVGQCFPRPAHC